MIMQATFLSRAAASTLCRHESGSPAHATAILELLLLALAEQHLLAIHHGARLFLLR